MLEMGKILIIFGGTLILLGVIFIFIPKVPYLGKLPGDIYIKKENFNFYFPLTSCLIISFIVSFIIWFFKKLF